MRTVTWTMPEAASDTLMETLAMDAESKAFDTALRAEIKEALAQVTTETKET